jgi:hypothetical protein
VARKRARWKAYQSRIAPSRLAFIDETWVKTNMAPLRGWGPRGRRLKAYAPHGHWKTLTFIAALRHDGIDAPFVIDGWRATIMMAGHRQLNWPIGAVVE